MLVLIGLVSCGDEPQPPPVESNATAKTDAFEVRVVAPNSVREGERFQVTCEAPSAGNQHVRCSWIQLQSQPKLVIPPVYGPQIELVAPEWMADYELKLQVRAGVGAQDVVRDFSVHVQADDDAPTAELVAPASAECGELVSLVGQSHNEVFQEVRVTWRQVCEGPRVAFDATDRFQAHFFAPEHTSSYSIDVEFSVDDGHNPPATKSARIAIECDPASVPLPAGSELALASIAGVEQALPRGAWTLEGSLELAPRSADAPAQARLRFTSGELCGALVIDAAQREVQLSTSGLARSPEGVWFEPEFKSGMPLGPWPADVPLGFEFACNGREVSARFGPAGARDAWPELPFEIVLPIGRRPRAFGIDVVGGDAKLGPLLLRAQ